jgi:hypothetical protein
MARSKIKPSQTASNTSSVDRKRSLAAKKGAVTRAYNLELASKRALRLHHKLITGGAIAAVLVLAFLGVRSQLQTYAANIATGTFVGLAGKCLDNQHSVVANHNQIQLYTCNGTNAQKWTLTSGGALVSSNGSNYCIDVPGDSTAQYVQLQLFSCNGTNAQKWVVANDRITSKLTGFCITVKNGNTSNSTPLLVQRCNGGSSQKWAYSGTATTGVTSGTTSGSSTGGTTTSGSGTTTGSTTGSSTGGTTSTGATNSGTSTNSVAGNIAILPDFYDSKWLTWNDGYDKFPVTWQGYTNVLEVSPNPQFIVGQRASGWTGENEINGMLCNNGATTGCTRDNRTTRVSVRPGQKITYSGYVWVTPSTVGAPNGGGFQFFMDIYGANGRIKELQGTNGCDGCGRVNVPFGSSGWTFVQMQVTVASSYRADGAIGGGAGTYVTPTSIIPILQLNNFAMPNGYNEKANAYIRNTILTIQ